MQVPFFCRRDSFVTHRAFCDALAQENNKLAQPMNMATVASALQGQAALPPSTLQADDDVLDAAEDDFDGMMDTKSPQLRMLPISDDPPLIPPPLGMAGCMLSGLAARSVTAPAFSFSGNSRINNMMGLDMPHSDPGVGFSSASMSATALLQKAAELGATTSVYGSAPGFPGSGFGPMFGGGPDRVPPMSPFGPPLPAQTQLVGFDVGGLLPGQQYRGGSMTRAIGSLMHGGLQQGVDHRRQDDDDDKRVVDDQSFSGVGPFGSHMGTWT